MMPSLPAAGAPPATADTPPVTGAPGPGRPLATVLVLAALALAALAVFGVSLSSPFLFDDVVALNHRYRLEPGLPGIGQTLLGTDRVGLEWYYRPPVTYSLAVNWALGRWDPWGYHAFNLAVHVVNAWLLYFLLLRLGSPRLAAALGALVFAVHPVHVEGVAAISQRAPALGSLFLLAGWLACLRPGAAALALSLGAYFAGLLCYECVAVLPAVALLSEYALGRLPDRRAWWRAGVRAASFLVPFALYFACRLTATGTLHGGRAVYFQGCSWLVGALTMARFGVEHYLPGVIAGVRLTSDYTPPSVPHARLDEAWAWACAGLLALLVAAATLRLARRRSLAALGALTCGLGFLPVSNLVVPFYGLGAQRYAYLPSIGLALVGAAAYQRCARSSAQVVRRLGLPAFLVATGALACAAVHDTRDWSEPVRFYRSLLAETPDNPVAHHNLARALAARGDLAGAEAHYRRSLELTPGEPLGLHDLGWCLLRRGRPEEAEAAFAEVLGRAGPGGEGTRVEPERARLLAGAWTGQASILRGRGQEVRAEECLRTAVGIDPTLATAWDHLGRLLEATGRLPEAEDAYRRGMAAQPPDFAPCQNLGELLAKTGKAEQAAAAYREAIAREPSAPEPYLALGLLLMRRGEAGEGERVLRVFLERAATRPEFAGKAAEVRRRLDRAPRGPDGGH